MRRLQITLITVLIYSFSARVMVFSKNNDKHEDYKHAFNVKYQIWKDFIRDATGLSGSGISTDQYKDIIDLGRPAIPYLFENVHNDPILWYAIRIITKKWWLKEEMNYPSHRIDLEYINWWRNRRQGDDELFDQYYTIWRESRANGDEQKVKTYYGKMVRMGIFIIPNLIEKLNEDEKDLIGMLSYLNDKSTSPDSTVQECKEWWSKNKESWIIP
ncbi:hypothetical protein JW905_01055 [bacterium]|nr:hypothetical protein [candidate division CSSED10-310 bacterium]